MPRRQGSEITLLNQEPGLPALSKPEIRLPDRCNSAAPSPTLGSGRTLLGESVDRQTQESGSSSALDADRFLPSLIIRSAFSLWWVLAE